MRTTLDIDEDVLQAARELAAARQTTIGKALSEMARQSLSPREGGSAVRNGVPLLPPRPGEALVTMEHVNRLRDDE
jgi:hypothetical protein